MSTVVQKVGEYPYVTPPKLTKQSSNPVAIPTDALHGVDYISYAIPIYPDDVMLQDERWERVRKTSKKTDVIYDNYRCAVTVGHAQVYLYLMPLNDRLTVSFNPSRVFSKASTATLCPSGAVARATELVLHELLLMFGDMPFGNFNQHSGEVSLTKGWELMLRVKRLDAARDFIFDDQLVETVSSFWAAVVPYKNRTRWNVENEAKGSRYYSQTTKQEGLDKIYNKAGQLREAYGVKSAVPHGMFRYETEIKSNRLKTSGIVTLKDITEEKVWNATERFWAKTGYGVTVYSPSSAFTALDGLSNTMRYKLRGFLEYAAEGLMDLSDRSEKRYYEMALKLGLLPGLPIKSFGERLGVVDLFKGGLAS
jgi:hypothetical protein